MRRGNFRDDTVDYAAVGATQAADLMHYPPERSIPAEESWRIGSGEARFLGAGLRCYFLALSTELPAPSLESAATKASWGTSTRPTIFIRFLPSFCFSSSLRLRLMSPP